MRRTIEEIQESVPTCCYHVDIPVGSLFRNLQQYRVDMDPDYQRNYVWTEEQKSKYVGALLQNPRGMTPLIFNKLKTGCQVLDGKQRISAVVEWLHSRIDALTPDGDIITFESLDEVERRAIETSITMSWNFVRLSRRQTLEYYLSLNSGGTVHTEEDLEHVRKLLEKEDSE